MGSKRKIEDASSGRNKTKKPRQAAPQPQTIKIASVRSARECAPAIASTPGLCVPSSLNFQAYTKPAPSQKKSKKAALPELLLHASTDRVDYTAKEDGDGGVATHLKHYIGVFDPTTGKLDVIEAKKMTVRGVPRAQKAPEDKSAEVYQTMTEQRNTLGMEFGTKKAKKAIASITENAIGPAKSNVEGATKLDSSSLAIMDSMSEAARSVASRDQLQATADQAKPIPPGHFDATEIQDVYLPEELIGADLLSSIPIKDWQDIAKKQSPLTSPNKYVTENFWEVARSLHPVRDLRILRYLNCLLTIVKNLRKGKERGSFKLPDRKKLQELLDPAPVQLIDSIRRKFSEGGDVRKFHMDLVKTYCCALASILHNYEFDTESLRYDLQLTEKEFAQYYRTIGGKVLVRAGPKDGPKGVKTQIAKLALPLEFPQMRFARRR